MSSRSETNLTPSRFSRDPFGLLRQMTSELDRVFDEPAWPSLRWPTFALATSEAVGWSPGIDVFEKDLDLVADLHVVRRVELAALEDAFALEPELDDEVVAVDAADAPLDDGAGGDVLDVVALHKL